MRPARPVMITAADIDTAANDQCSNRRIWTSVPFTAGGQYQCLAHPAFVELSLAEHCRISGSVLKLSSGKN